jgi:hypothetical protein
MRTYYGRYGNAQKDPFSVDELIGENMKTNTLVWYERAGEWAEAGKAEELKILFVVIPQPLHKVLPISTNVSNPTKAINSKNAGEAVGRKVAGSWTLRAIITLANMAVLGYGGYNFYKGKQVEDQKSFIRNIPIVMVLPETARIRSVDSVEFLG